MGNDETTTKGAGYMFISIHVPSWGTTEEAIDIDDDEVISIHVPSWGTTMVFALLVYVSAISIHVPSWGTTVFLRKLTI